MNTEEAQKTYNAAMSYFKAGEYVKALKLFKFSNSVNQSDVTESYIRRCEHALKETQTNSPSSSPTPPSSATQETSASRPPKEENGSGSTASRPQDPNSSSGEAPKYTQEQVDDCKRMLRTKDFYEILGVQKNAEENDIKKSYRKLALKFHPDKNHAPQAKEAFMKVGQAYDCLTNKDKRAYYDQTGSADADQHYRQYTQQYHYEEFSPDDLFEMIFGIPSGHRRRPARQHYYHEEEDVGARHRNTHQGRGNVPRGKYAALLQLLPLLFVLLSSFLYSFQGEEEAVYSLSPHGKYGIQQATRRLNINYFVMNDFKTKHAKNERELLRVENDVEEQYMIFHYRKCEQAKSNRERVLMQARWYYGAERERLVEVAKNIDLSTCDEFRRVHNVIDPRGRWF